MTDLITMAFRHRVLSWWGSRISTFAKQPTWSTNRHLERPRGAKTLALLVPSAVRVRVETVQARWGCDSFARTGQTAMLVGLAVMESTGMAPDPRHRDLLHAIESWVRAGHPRQGPEFVALARISERWIGTEEDTHDERDEDG